MRQLAVIALALIVTGCSSVTYNCNVADSCPRAPKPGVSLTISNGAAPSTP